MVLKQPSTNATTTGRPSSTAGGGSATVRATSAASTNRPAKTSSDAPTAASRRQTMSATATSLSSIPDGLSTPSSRRQTAAHADLSTPSGSLRGTSATAAPPSSASGPLNDVRGYAAVKRSEAALIEEREARENELAILKGQHEVQLGEAAKQVLRLQGSLTERDDKIAVLERQLKDQATIASEKEHAFQDLLSSAREESAKRQARILILEKALEANGIDVVTLAPFQQPPSVTSGPSSADMMKEFESRLFFSQDTTHLQEGRTPNAP